jgi:hypothetical protein
VTNNLKIHFVLEMVKVGKLIQGLVEWPTLAPGVPSNVIDLGTKDGRLPLVA